jgi:hypothetical protein
MQKWSVDIIRGGRAEHLGTIEAPDQREAYRLAIDKFNVPIEHQNRLFVGKLNFEKLDQMADPYAQAHQAIGAFMCEFSKLEHELGEALKVVLGLQTNRSADAIVGLIGDFTRKANIVREAVQTATQAGDVPTSQAWKDNADKTLREVLGCNYPDRIDLAHSHLKPQSDGSVILQRPGKTPETWSTQDLNDKITNLSRLASEVARIHSELNRMNIPVPTGWMSMDNNYLRRQMSDQHWEALKTTFGGTFPGTIP